MVFSECVVIFYMFFVVGFYGGEIFIMFLIGVFILVGNV